MASRRLLAHPGIRSRRQSGSGRLGKKCVSLIRLADKSRTDTSKVQQRIPMDAEGKEIDDFTALREGKQAMASIRKYGSS